MFREGGTMRNKNFRILGLTIGVAGAALFGMAVDASAQRRGGDDRGRGQDKKTERPAVQSPRRETPQVPARPQQQPSRPSVMPRTAPSAGNNRPSTPSNNNSWRNSRGQQSGDQNRGNDRVIRDQQWQRDQAQRQAQQQQQQRQREEQEKRAAQLRQQQQDASRRDRGNVNTPRRGIDEMNRTRPGTTPNGDRGNWNGSNNGSRNWDRDQQRRIQEQRQREYNARFQNWQSLERQRQDALRRSNRMRYLQYQERYWAQVRRDQLRLQQARYYDNLYNNYRYNRGGNWYYTSQYGAQMIQSAIQNGYEEGYRAGQADRYDNWGYNYNNSYGYTDASYGYDSYYIGLDEYSYYFREGFRRGYEDGYYGRYTYGSYSGGRYQILGNVLSSIFSFVIN